MNRAVLRAMSRHRSSCTSALSLTCRRSIRLRRCCGPLDKRGLTGSSVTTMLAHRSRGVASRNFGKGRASASIEGAAVQYAGSQNGVLLSSQDSGSSSPPRGGQLQRAGEDGVFGISLARHDQGLGPLVGVSPDWGRVLVERFRSKRARLHLTDTTRRVSSQVDRSL